MSTAHLVAWLTCLVMAFFACVLGVFNTGRRIGVERELANVTETVKELAARPADSVEMKGACDNLAKIREDLRGIGESLPPEANQELRKKLSDLDERLENVQGQLGGPSSP